MTDTEITLRARLEDTERALQAYRVSGNALWDALEHWIQNNSGFCHPRDIEAIDNWKSTTNQQDNT